MRSARALLRAVPCDRTSRRLRERLLARGGAGWWDAVLECVVSLRHSRIARERLRIVCRVCRESYWTPLDKPAATCWHCDQTPHPGYGHPCPSFPLSEYRYHGGYPIEAGQGELTR